MNLLMNTLTCELLLCLHMIYWRFTIECHDRIVVSYSVRYLKDAVIDRGQNSLFFIRTIPSFICCATRQIFTLDFVFVTSLLILSGNVLHEWTFYCRDFSFETIHCICYQVQFQIVTRLNKHDQTSPLSYSSEANKSQVTQYRPFSGISNADRSQGELVT